ncbi:MAG TPA: hypothetical protein PKH58_08305, partial [Paludibacteraceae bacterium]|nr:hypothetical protein [Paludibacteraceae bacterium]
MKINIFRSVINAVVLSSFIPSMCIQAQNQHIVVHDPVAIESEGTYYIFNTGRGIASLKSNDLKNWQFMKPVFDVS